jgi:hypothetical protein
MTRARARRLFTPRSPSILCLTGCYPAPTWPRVEQLKQDLFYHYGCADDPRRWRVADPRRLLARGAWSVKLSVHPWRKGRRQ